ncbi:MULTISPECIES: hypothetical protein [Pantoea]|uniref:hypothetical protein n=1 Tax=Pantoea TaxID=53335 RepID=UPI001B316025|nr:MULTISPECIES: hypothetical protein [Pantoea]MCS3403271.1 hypothetical protein [Pantoea sp. B566]
MLLKKILMIEDDRDAGVALEAYLHRESFILNIAGDRQGGLALLHGLGNSLGHYTAGKIA